MVPEPSAIAQQIPECDSRLHSPHRARPGGSLNEQATRAHRRKQQNPHRARPGGSLTEPATSAHCKPQNPHRARPGGSLTEPATGGSETVVFAARRGERREGRELAEVSRVACQSLSHRDKPGGDEANRR
jgi:hypothetical protein